MRSVPSSCRLGDGVRRRRTAKSWTALEASGAGEEPGARRTTSRHRQTARSRTQVPPESGALPGDPGQYVPKGLMRLERARERCRRPSRPGPRPRRPLGACGPPRGTELRAVRRRSPSRAVHRRPPAAGLGTRTRGPRGGRCRRPGPRCVGGRPGRRRPTRPLRVAGKERSRASCPRPTADGAVRAWAPTG